MSVRVGSARIDERGSAIGGKAGDQTGREVATENWYLHGLLWYVLRAKDPAAREKIAQDMEYACANPKIGYDQGQNQSLLQVAKKVGYNCSKVQEPCETDCARLVRVCVLYAGIDSPDFYTGTELAVLYGTGKFSVLKSDKYCRSSDYLRRGDILVTRSRGHTVVVLDDGAKVKKETFKPYKVKITKDVNVRTKPRKASKQVMKPLVLKKGKEYTIVKKSRSGKWGKLKIGGWIALPGYTKKV